MEQPKHIKEELIISNDLKLLTKAYQEYAVQQINFARYSVLASRAFVDELIEIFYNVKSSYKHAQLELEKHPHRKHIQPTTLKKNGKDVLVLITANNKLYGDIIPRVARAFFDAARSSQADLVIVGKQGKTYFAESKLQRPYTYFEIPDTNVSTAVLKDMMKNLIEYETIRVFYGKFNNVISQEPVEVSVSGDLPPDKKTGEEQHNFLFEPTIGDVLHFFESQIFYLILDQTINEAQLGKFASRIKAMEAAQQNMEKWIDKLKKKEARLKSLLSNKKQQEQIAGRSLWGGR